VRTEAGPAESSESSKSDISESRSSISSSEISSSRSEISGINGPLKLRHQIHQKRVPEESEEKAALESLETETADE
jgi:hypothetical protein